MLSWRRCCSHAAPCPCWLRVRSPARCARSSADGAGAALRSRHPRRARSPIRGCPLVAAPPQRSHRQLPLTSPQQPSKTCSSTKELRKNPISLPPYSRYCDKDVNLNHRLLSLFHLLLCHHVFWGSKLRTIILDLASDRANKANTNFLLIDAEIGYWNVRVIRD